MQDSTVSLTPDPRILATIAQNPMKPIDALSELIDNSLDGFSAALDSGHPIENPTVRIDIPSINEIGQDIGILRINDNGLGLSRDQAISAVTAGFSGQDNPVDRLGLFGMGFNISTAKLGRETKFITYQRSGQRAHEILINIPKMMENRNFDAQVKDIDYNQESGGTSIEISSWWPHGHQNFGFIQSLARQSKPKIREQIGRRYSLLIEKGFRIVINGEDCKPFKHYVWTESRSVSHREIGNIPAKIYIDQDLGQEFRCKKCWKFLDNGEVSMCPTCDTQDPVRIITKKIKGWVGIQRFDDASMYGIDLIRNGRVIRDSEKDAFFNFRTEDGEDIKDYPIDSQYGRIIGSLEFDHIPVNYLKTDFDRTSIYWQEAIEYLRGKTSLQPKRAEGENDSVIYRLFQGYRKVRSAGTKELYMGTYNPQKNESGRISREVEKEFRDRFDRDEIGYGYDDDSEWYKKVVEADLRPSIGLKSCDQGHDNPIDAEVCNICSFIFNKKTCINPECGKNIQQSALSCSYCGTDQSAGTEELWVCNICTWKNSPTLTDCTNCGSVRGSVDPFTPEELKTNSELDDELTIKHKNIVLPNDERMEINARVYRTRPDQTLSRGGIRLPLITKFSNNGMDIFIDQTHSAFIKYQDRYEDYIAIAIAEFIHQEKASRILGDERVSWSISSLYFLVHDQLWQGRTRLDHNQLVTDINSYFNDVIDKLPYLLGDKKDEVLNELDEQETRTTYMRAMQYGQSFDELTTNGKYLKYLPATTFIKMVNKYPENFFDGKLWADKYMQIESQIGEENSKRLRKEIVENYVASLKDILSYSAKEVAPMNIQTTHRAYSSLSLLSHDK